MNFISNSTVLVNITIQNIYTLYMSQLCINAMLNKYAFCIKCTYIYISDVLFYGGILESSSNFSKHRTRQLLLIWEKSNDILIY